MKLNHYFEINVGKKGARNVKFSNNGQLVITNCGDKKIRCYQFSDLGQNKKPKPIVLESTLGNPGGLDLSPCGNYLIAGDEEGEIDQGKSGQGDVDGMIPRRVGEFAQRGEGRREGFCLHASL